MPRPLSTRSSRTRASDWRASSLPPRSLGSGSAVAARIAQASVRLRPRARVQLLAMKPNRVLRLAALAICAARAHAASAAACSVERWEEKTLTDDRAGLIDFTPKDTTVDALRRKNVRVSRTATTRPASSGRSIECVRSWSASRARRTATFTL
jgi:hypothetical protein